MYVCIYAYTQLLFFLIPNHIHFTQVRIFTMCTFRKLIHQSLLPHILLLPTRQKIQTTKSLSAMLGSYYENLCFISLALQCCHVANTSKALIKKFWIRNPLSGSGSSPKSINWSLGTYTHTHTPYYLISCAPASNMADNKAGCIIITVQRLSETW